MNDIDEFNLTVGKTIMHCQCIERDIKYIYSGMAKGDFKENYFQIKIHPLGPILKKLNKLDNSDGNHTYLTLIIIYLIQ